MTTEYIRNLPQCLYRVLFIIAAFVCVLNGLAKQAPSSEKKRILDWNDRKKYYFRTVGGFFFSIRGIERDME